MTFKLHTPYSPGGDQPKAIETLSKGLIEGREHQTLLGVTGSGKTFSMANVIANYGKPTLVIAHNKTLAAQLAAEYREFFPENAVQYFVSYYDYYQPEAYVPTSDTYIEKEAMINEDIERLRHAATQALLTRKDVIVVATVSCIYGLGSPDEYENINLKIEKGGVLSRADLVRRLIALYFERTTADLSPGTFRALGNRVEIMPANERVIYQVSFTGNSISEVAEIDAVTRAREGERDAVFLFPAKHYVMPEDVTNAALKDIEKELKKQLSKFEKEGKLLEADRLKRRTRQDITMIREFGYTNGIENYSRHFDRRKPGEPPYSLIDYFPKKKDGTPDFLTVIDESHVTVPQIGGMYAGDRSRKLTLVEHGFRLPSAIDNRPLTFDEFAARIGQTIYTSATPGTYELEHSGDASCAIHTALKNKDHQAIRDIQQAYQEHEMHPESCRVVEQIIRPTGLLDPQLIVRPVVGKGSYNGQVQDFIAEVEATTKRGFRTLATVLTKKMAEDLTDFLKEKGIKAQYLHSDIKTVERIEILTQFRKGDFDVLVGVNLLREGLDLPEVALVGILDADKEGFLRSDTALIQTIGRAARNVHGRVILYADHMTGSLERSIGETNRRRAIQEAYNTKHGITPQTIIKAITDITGDIDKVRKKAITRMAEMDVAAFGGDTKKLVKAKREQMHAAAEALDFETAALLRDEIRELEEGTRKK